MIFPLTELGFLGDAASLWLALVVGAAFGWCLERAGLANARKLAGQFHLTDFTVAKVMLTAIVTAALGVFWLGRVGVLDLDRVYVPETWLVPQLVGGAVFGVGFAAAALCPGTACVSAATGRGDGLVAFVGVFVGMAGAGLAFRFIAPLYDLTSRGAFTLPELLHVSYGAVLAAITVVALGAFVVAEHRERRAVGVGA